MTHTHDRTLIQAIGADLDHKTPLHDVACLYLQSKAENIIKQFCPSISTGNPDEFGDIERQITFDDLLPYVDKAQLAQLEFLKLCQSCYYIPDPHNVTYCYKRLDPHLVNTSLEMLITKGSGQYRSHIGFIDLIINAGFTYRTSFYPTIFKLHRLCHHVTHGQNNVVHINYPGKVAEHKTKQDVKLLIEVKTTKCPIGDLIRQIKLYRQYIEHHHNEVHFWIAATTYSITNAEKYALQNEQIEPIFIHPDFVKTSKTITLSVKMI